VTWSPSRPGGLSPRWWLWGIGVLLLGAGSYTAFGGDASPSTPTRTHANPSSAVPVVAARARSGSMPVYLSGLGTVTALRTVTVRTQVDGQLIDVAFQEGQLVHAGDRLAQIDPRPFQVQLEQAEGQKARDEATLANARVDLERYKALVAIDAAPRQQLDTQVSTIAQLEAGLKADQAQIDAARLNLTYARITSPVTGRIGLRQVDPGNIVHTTDQGGLAVITQRQPIAVVFTVAQDHLPELLRQLRGTRRPLAVDAFDRDLSTKLASGTLLAVDSEIDPATGTIKLKATFPNEDEALFPNQFVNARLLVDTVRDAVIVPTAALQRGPQETYVYVVNANGAVQSRTVQTSLEENDETVVTKGLAAGEVVVTDGADRLQPGSQVTVRFADERPQAGSS
jgi:membrane fusion protein, multidrug efflux system